MIEEKTRVPNRYWLIDKFGERAAEFTTAEGAARHANLIWPDQEQDETRNGKGWDIEVCNG